MSISEIQQIANRLLSTVSGDKFLQYQTPQHLGDFEIQEVRSVQGLLVRIDSALNPLPRRCLKEASQPSQTRRGRSS